MSKPPPEKETYKQTDFVEAAMPKGKRKGKWTIATTLLKDKIAKEVHNAKKRRLNNKSGKNRKAERQGRVIHDVEKVAPNEHGKYLYYDWREEEAERNTKKSEGFFMKRGAVINLERVPTLHNSEGILRERRAKIRHTQSLERVARGSTTRCKVLGAGFQNRVCL